MKHSTLILAPLGEVQILLSEPGHVTAVAVAVDDDEVVDEEVVEEEYVDDETATAPNSYIFNRQPPPQYSDEFPLQTTPQPDTGAPLFKILFPQTFPCQNMLNDNVEDTHSTRH